MAKPRMLVLTAIVGLLALAAGCGYTDPFGNNYDPDQVSRYCQSVRPGSAAYARHDCGNVLSPTQ